MTISTTKNKNWRGYAGKLLAAAFWLTVWQLVYLAVGQEILVVSPVRVFQRLLELAGGGEFWLMVLFSVWRIVLGFFIAVVSGTLLAAATTASRPAEGLFQPLVSVIKATPVASFIILALVWMEKGRVPVFAAFLMVLPIVWSNVANGIRKTDRTLLEMAKVYQFGPVRTFQRVYAPSVAPYFMAACTTGMGLAWKAGVAAEVLITGAVKSIGGQIYNAKIYLETADLFAWTAVVITISVLLEALMVRLMRLAGKRYNVL